MKIHPLVVAAGLGVGLLLLSRRSAAATPTADDFQKAGFQGVTSSPELANAPALSVVGGAYTPFSEGASAKLFSINEAAQQEYNEIIGRAREQAREITRKAVNAGTLTIAQGLGVTSQGDVIQAGGSLRTMTQAAKDALTSGQNVIVGTNPTLNAGKQMLQKAIDTGMAQISKSGKVTGVISSTTKRQTPSGSWV